MDFRLHQCDISGEISVLWTSYPVWDRFSPKRALKVAVFQGYVDPRSVSANYPKKVDFCLYFFFILVCHYHYSHFFISLPYSGKNLGPRGTFTQLLLHCQKDAWCLNSSSSSLVSGWRYQANVF